MINNVSIRKMRVLLSVVEERSFTKASVKQGISQPATTIIINDIESQSGCELFERSGASRKTVLTSEGEKVAEVFSRIVGAFDYEISRIKNEIGGRRDNKEIMIQDSFASSLSGPWLQSLFKTFKGYNIRFNSCSRAEVLERIHSRDACLGIIDGHALSDKSDYRHIASDTFVALVRSPNSQPTGVARTHLRWDQLPRDCILYTGISADTLKEAKARLRSTDGTEGNHLEVNSPELVATLVQQTGMPAILPGSTARSILQGGGLSCLQINGPSVEIPIGVVMPWGNMHSTKFEALSGEAVFPGLYQ